jgi:hypothetical protein
MAFRTKLKAFTNNRYLKLAVGCVLFFTGLNEVGENIWSDITSMNVGAHHGIMVLGFFQALQSLPEILSGVNYFVDDVE